MRWLWCEAIELLMANCIGFCDNFMSVGGSGVWNDKGLMVGQLASKEEGLLIYDMEKETCQVLPLASQ